MSPFPYRPPAYPTPKMRELWGALTDPKAQRRLNGGKTYLIQSIPTH